MGPAGQHPERDPYAGMTDDAVLKRARDALVKASALPKGSVQRALTWAVFDDAMMELSRRAIRHVIAKLAEMEDE